MNIKNLKVGQRLALSFGIVLALLVVLALMSYVRLGDIAADVKVSNEDFYPKTVLAHTIKDELNEIAGDMRDALLTTEPDRIKKHLGGSGRLCRIKEHGAVCDRFDHRNGPAGFSEYPGPLRAESKLDKPVGGVLYLRVL